MYALREYIGEERVNVAVRSGEQQITVKVPKKPARAGIDPRSLLIDVEATDNLREITSGKYLSEITLPAR